MAGIVATAAGAVRATVWAVATVATEGEAMRVATVMQVAVVMVVAAAAVLAQLALGVVLGMLAMRLLGLE